MYKTKYHVATWASYDRALVRRGDVTVWLSPEAIATWKPARRGTRGGQRKYSDLAIDTALTLRLLFHLRLRQAEGFLHSLLAMMGLELSAPDHTTLSRRGQGLDLTLHRVPANNRIHLIVDSTGLSILGEGEWAAATVDDAAIGLTLIEKVDGALASVTGDAAYDTIAFYDAAAARGTRVIVPPTKTARVSRRRPRSSARDRTIKTVKTIGRRRWKKASGYHRQARVENAIFRYKSIIGNGLRARTPEGQAAEALLACNVLNQMAELNRVALTWDHHTKRAT